MDMIELESKLKKIEIGEPYIGSGGWLRVKVNDEEYKVGDVGKFFPTREDYLRWFHESMKKLIEKMV